MGMAVCAQQSNSITYFTTNNFKRIKKAVNKSKLLSISDTYNSRLLERNRKFIIAFTHSKSTDGAFGFLFEKLSMVIRNHTEQSTVQAAKPETISARCDERLLPSITNGLEEFSDQLLTDISNLAKEATKEFQTTSEATTSCNIS